MDQVSKIHISFLFVIIFTYLNRKFLSEKLYSIDGSDKGIEKANTFDTFPQKS